MDMNLIDNEEPTVKRNPIDNQEPTVKRQLKARHMTMIAIGGSIGTGLFLASGATIQSAGPGGALAAYACIGIMVYFLMTSLGKWRHICLYRDLFPPMPHALLIPHSALHLAGIIGLTGQSRLPWK